MATRRAWFGTVQLWEHFQYWSIDLQRSGDMYHQGVTRERPNLSPGSPNFDRTIRVVCVVGPSAADGSIDDGSVTDMRLDDTANALIAIGKSLATLKYTDDGTNVRESIADCAFVGMSYDSPDVDGPQFRRNVTYTFRAKGALTVNGLSAFRNAVI